MNIKALTIAENEDFGILRMVVDNPEDAVKLLKESGMTANLTDIVAVEIDDKPGGLAKILELIENSDLNVEYMYGFVEPSGQKALMAFRFDDPDKAIEVLKL